MELESIKYRMAHLKERLDRCISDEYEEQLYQRVIRLENELITLLNEQYEAIKHVALGDHIEFKKQLEMLFEINELLK